MNRKILKLFIIIWLFTTLIWNTFAFESTLKVDKKEVALNDYINLTLDISSYEWWQVWIKNIKWIENFDIINKGQSQKSSSSVVIINWKTETKTKSIINLNFTLKPKVKWEFNIWPAILEKDKQEVTTNIVSVKVWWKSLNPNTVQNNSIINLWNNINNKTDTIKNIEKKEFYDKWIYLLIIVLLITWAWYYFLLKKNNIINKKQEKDLENNNIKTNSKQNKNNNEIDFEKQNIEIKYPSLDDKDFLNKIDNIFREKIFKIYNIKNIKNLTFEEILKIIENLENWDNSKLDDIKSIIKLINKMKYSNLLWDKNKLFNLIKEL